MTPIDLGPIKERCGKATLYSPLVLDRYDHGGGRLYVKEPVRDLVADFYDEGNREFYAHCVSDVPALVTEVERLRAEAADVRTLLDAAEEMIRSDAHKLGQHDERGDWCSRWLAGYAALRAKAKE